MEKAMTQLGLIFASLTALLFKLFVITKVWGYVAVKLFGLPPIGLWKAFALSCLFGLVTFKAADLTTKKQTTEERVVEILTYSVVLSLGWFIDWVLFGRG